MYLGLLLCYVSLGCAQQKQIADPIQEIKYSAASRGFHFEVRVRKNQIMVAKDNGLSALEDALPASIWNELKGMAEGLNLEGLDRLEAPSNASATDRAAIAFVEIRTNQKTYQSSSFDHGHPPKALEALVKKIVQLPETVE